MLGRDLAAFDNIRLVVIVEVVGKLEFDRREQMRRGTLEMRVHHIDQRLAAVGTAGLGNLIQQPVIGSTIGLADPAGLDQLIRKRNELFLGCRDWNHLDKSLTAIAYDHGNNTAFKTPSCSNVNTLHAIVPSVTVKRGFS